MMIARLKRCSLKISDLFVPADINASAFLVNQLPLPGRFPAVFTRYSCQAFPNL